VESAHRKYIMKVNFPFLLLSPFSQQLQLAAGHGALMSPTTRRGNTGYENDPVSSITGNDMVCRHGAPNTNVPLVAKAAGSTLDLMWDFGAAHVGDCAVFISYDISANRADQKYFKIANLPDCRAQNKQAVTITLPDFLPAGQAVLRWDWSALHTWPSVEFYSQCIDLQISSSANSVAISSINTYSIISPAIYPRNGKSGVGFRCPFNPNTEQYMTGTACARSYTGNNCDLTKAGTTGNTGGGGEDPGGGGGDDGGGGDMTPICDVYVVKAGDTLSAIANIYIAQGVSVTWQEICQFNGISNSCDAIEGERAKRASLLEDVSYSR